MHGKSFNQEPLQSNIPFVALGSSELEEEEQRRTVPSFLLHFIRLSMFRSFLIALLKYDSQLL